MEKKKEGMEKSELLTYLSKRLSEGKLDRIAALKKELAELEADVKED